MTRSLPPYGEVILVALTGGDRLSRKSVHASRRFDADFTAIEGNSVTVDYAPSTDFFAITWSR
jgi:hypothetical protein